MSEERRPWTGYFDERWLSQAKEPVLDPELAIVDAHHHLMAWPFHYELAETVADLVSSHTVSATVHVEAHGHYREQGPEHLRPVGETEHVVAAAEETARAAGAPRIAAGIVAAVDVKRGAAIDEVLDAHAEAARGRLRGIRVNLYWNMYADRPWTPSDVGSLVDSPEVRAALAQLAPRNLTCDVVAFHPNLADVSRTAAAFPDTAFIVNHMGAPMSPGGNPAPDEVWQSWTRGIDVLAAQPNVRIKLGGCTNPMLCRWLPGIAALKEVGSPPPSSDRIAEAYRPYVEHCVGRLGPERCMFEGNFPIDKAFASHTTLWNAFKRLARRYSHDERLALLGGTATATYRI